MLEPPNGVPHNATSGLHRMRPDPVSGHLLLSQGAGNTGPIGGERGGRFKALATVRT